MGNKQDFVELIGEDWAILNAVDSVDTEANTVVLTDSGIDSEVTGPVRFATTNTLPAPLVAGTDYWLVLVSTETFKVATSLENATEEPPITLTITTAGTGTHTVLAPSDETPIADEVEMALIDTTQAGNRTQPTDLKKERFETHLSDFAAFNEAQQGIIDGIFEQLDHPGVRTYPIEQVTERFWDAMIAMVEAAD